MNRKKFFGALLGLIGVKLSAQSGPAPTTIQPGQASVGPSATGALVGANPSTATGPGQTITLGPNLSISKNVLNITVPTVTGPTFVIDEVYVLTAVSPTMSTANTQAIPATISVYRNGLRQAVSLDYTVAGNTITWTANAMPNVGDRIIFDYQVP